MTTAERHRDVRPRTRYVPPTPDAIRCVPVTDLAFGRRLDTKAQQRLALEGQTEAARVWYAGDASVLKRRAVAIVGTRKATPEGAARARRLARELVEAGVTVVSGLADGIDTAALTAAIEAGGRVAAVIGTPLDKAYPAANAALQVTIHREHLLVSQFAAGSRVFPSNFPQRNKLMAALTDATAIMEAADGSGTIHQAAECVRLRRWLFIARAVAEDPTLEWPKGFLGDDKPRSSKLRETRDVLDALEVTGDAASG
jgi:DNA processing protein